MLSFLWIFGIVAVLMSIVEVFKPHWIENYFDENIHRPAFRYYGLLVMFLGFLFLLSIGFTKIEWILWFFFFLFGLIGLWMVAHPESLINLLDRIWFRSKYKRFVTYVVAVVRAFFAGVLIYSLL